MEKTYLPEEICTFPAKHVRYSEATGSGNLSVWIAGHQKDIDPDLGIVIRLNRNFSLGIEYSTPNEDFYVARIFPFRQHEQYQAYPISKICTKHEHATEPSLKNFPLQLDHHYTQANDTACRYLPFVNYEEQNPQPNIICPLKKDKNIPSSYSAVFNLRAVCIDTCMDTEYQEKLPERAYSDINLFVSVEKLHNFARQKTMSFQCHFRDNQVKAKHKRMKNVSTSLSKMYYTKIHEQRLLMYDHLLPYTWLSFLQTELEAESNFPYRQPFIHLAHLNKSPHSTNQFLAIYRHHTILSNMVTHNTDSDSSQSDEIKFQEKSRLQSFKLFHPLQSKKLQKLTKPRRQRKFKRITKSLKQDLHNQLNLHSGHSEAESFSEEAIFSPTTRGKTRSSLIKNSKINIAQIPPESIFPISSPTSPPKTPEETKKLKQDSISPTSTQDLLQCSMQISEIPNNLLPVVEITPLELIGDYHLAPVVQPENQQQAEPSNSQPILTGPPIPTQMSQDNTPLQAPPQELVHQVEPQQGAAPPSFPQNTPYHYRYHMYNSTSQSFPQNQTQQSLQQFTTPINQTQDINSYSSDTTYPQTWDESTYFSQIYDDLEKTLTSL